MRVNVEFLSLPLITQPLGKKKIDIDFPGTTLSDLAHELALKIDKVKGVLTREDGRIDDDIQIYVNGADRIEREKADETVLNQGDTVTFMLIVAGG